MERKSLYIVAITLLVAVAVIGAVMYSGVIGHGSISNPFGFNMQIENNPISSDVASPVFNLSNSLSFQQLANNSASLNPHNFYQAGWNSWHFTSQRLQIFTSYNETGNSTTVINFLQINNPLSFAVNLTLFENLTGHRIATYSIQQAGNNASGFVFAITNGTNYTLDNSTIFLHQTNASLVGYGHTLNGTQIAVIPSGYVLDIFLSSLPNSMPHHLAKIEGAYLSGGVMQISV